MAYKLGIDIGGTKIMAILLDKKNKPFFAFNIPTPKSKKSFLKLLKTEINGIIKKHKISGIGVGLPGIVDIKKGILIKAPNMPYLKNWLAKKFFSKFNKNIAVNNDSRCFTLAEAVFGAGKKYKNIVGLAIGTGIGSGIIIDRKIYYGKNFGAGEFGHTIMQIANRKAQSFEELGAKKAFLKYGDRSEIIGIGIANIINGIDPDIVILGGGGITNGGVNLNIIKKTAKKYIFPMAEKTPIVKTKLGENAQAIGAALMVK